ncbi:hypothetical protein A5719_11055 [Mycolicibacterium peregrinum]|uniref:DUF732 domain-containing protein n=1 Tax=Mycolicibacterium peregrinum TaxID=43304 RepID=UPI0007EC0963|nr:DUF732 domain-containing protein [Mycolicibacterium peregrinum]OBF41910.1 hypothetical protein A5719_11055 [Mycolicibacterium peregrinum]
MGKLLMKLGCQLIGVVCALHAAPLAQADNAAFVAEARALGFQQWDDVLIRMGMSACRFLQPELRRTPADVAQHLARYANVDTNQARRFLVLSVTEYCPQYVDRVGA